VLQEIKSWKKKFLPGHPFIKGECVIQHGQSKGLWLWLKLESLRSWTEEVLFTRDDLAKIGNIFSGYKRLPLQATLMLLPAAIKKKLQAVVPKKLTLLKKTTKSTTGPLYRIFKAWAIMGLNIMLKDLLTQKCAQKKVTDFG
jgi:hypothetical protein